MSDISYVEALKKVKELTEKYAKDPLGEGFEALHELKQLSANPNIHKAVNTLSDNAELSGKDLDLVKDFQQQVLSPRPLPTPLIKPVEPDKPKRESFPPPFGSKLPNPQEDYGKQLINFRKEYQADPAVKNLFNAKLASSVANNGIEDANRYAIMQWLAGSGPPNYFGATKLGPVWNNIGAATQGDIAGDINANLAEDNLDNAQFGEALGKVNAHMEKLTLGAQSVDEHLDRTAKATPPILHGNVLEKAVSAINSEVVKAVKASGPPAPAPTVTED